MVQYASIDRSITDLSFEVMPTFMIRLVEERGHLAAFRTYQKQPDKRSLPLVAQLHGWLHNWKVRYAEALVDALDLDRVTAPMDGVLANV